MHSFILQDWITLRGASQNPAVAIPQTEQTWLDLTPYQDVFFWLDAREVSGTTPAITFEPSPTSDDSLFQPMISQTALAPATPLLLKVLLASATTPLATWVRWKLSPVSGSAGPWDVTFRVLVAANMVGRAQAIPQGVGAGMQPGVAPQLTSS